MRKLITSFKLCIQKQCAHSYFFCITQIFTLLFYNHLYINVNQCKLTNTLLKHIENYVNTLHKKMLQKKKYTSVLSFKIMMQVFAWCKCRLWQWWLKYCLWTWQDVPEHACYNDSKAKLAAQCSPIAKEGVLLEVCIPQPRMSAERFKIRVSTRKVSWIHIILALSSSRRYLIYSYDE